METPVARTGPQLALMESQNNIQDEQVRSGLGYTCAIQVVLCAATWAKVLSARDSYILPPTLSFVPRSQLTRVTILQGDLGPASRESRLRQNTKDTWQMISCAVGPCFYRSVYSAPRNSY